MMDGYSEVSLGYRISEEEDYEAGYQAFKMAIQVSEYRPYQILLDNGAGKRSFTQVVSLMKLAISP